MIPDKLASHRTVLETLASYGSCRPIVVFPQWPVTKKIGVVFGDFRQPLPSFLRSPFQRLVFSCYQTLQSEDNQVDDFIAKYRLGKLTVVIDPAPHLRIDSVCKVYHRDMCNWGYFPRPNLFWHFEHCFITHSRKKRKKQSVWTFCATLIESVAQKVELCVVVLSISLTVLTIDNFCLFRMKC